MAERAAQDLGRERGATHAQQHDVAHFLVVNLRGEQLQRAQRLEHPLGDGQPAEAIGDLRRPLRPPQQRIAAAQPAGDIRLPRLRQLLLDRCSQRSREAGLDGQGGVAHATIVMGAALL
jgi:hypothetical protein